ncbi:toll/interleukin-1 receptor domain-containing protein [Clostridium tagluense]|uniref:toll/interleukin-1 receptor domain-containing protein n=1 Tax=Clostridium tagluense TaxID=360422 RepID=UPI001C0D4CDA|nr:toll/interleukin-1 receptor domain-containing protein [Clostridium tagluense]MBU3129851.1 toll/interleukin-1 receptor domain-containing protein [Clostridium tagluense]
MVDKELEIGQKSVKVLPILIEPCDIPPLLSNKIYADFTSEDIYEESLKKILNRLKKKGL